MTQTSTGLISLVGVFACSFSLGAQSPADSTFHTMTAIRCTFTATTRTAWKDGEPQPTVRTGVNGPVVTIRAINRESGSALLIRRPINKDLTVVGAGTDAMHFIDAGRGRVLVTTVLAEPGAATSFKAVQTIHDYTALDLGSFKAEPEVVQSVGRCEPEPPQ